MKIHYSDYKIINIVKDRSYDDLWNKTLTEISTGQDKLKNNYKEIDLSTFISFYIALEHDHIVGFSGLQYKPDRWGNDIARCMTRFYLHPKIRHGTSLFKRPLLTEDLLPRQILDAKEKNMSLIFMSRESGKQSFLKGLEYLKSKNCFLSFRMLDEKYNVCGHLQPIPASCQQYVAVMDLNSFAQESWDRSMLKHRII